MLEGLPAFSGSQWSTFVDDIRKYFEADRETKRYRINDVEVYVKKANRRRMRTPEHWNKYNRGFIPNVGWLKKEQRITDREANLFFWKGISRIFREVLEPRIMLKNPTHSTQNPFTIGMICTAVESLLSRDRFDNERLLSEDDSDSSNGD